MTSTPEPPFPPSPFAPEPHNPFFNPHAAKIPEFDPPDTEVDLTGLREECDSAWKLAGRVLGDAGTGREAITRSAREFSELIDSDISSAGAFNEKEWQKACLVLTYAASVADTWRRDVKEFRDKRQDLIGRYRSAALLAGLGKNDFSPTHPGANPFLQPGLERPPVYGPHAPSPRQIAYDEVHREFMRKGQKLKDELEETAEERATLLDEGPDPSNLKLLVEAGALGWGAYNILGADRDVPLPVSTGQAEKMAKEMEAYLDGDKEPDARFHEILAAVGAVAAKAEALQKANKPDMGPQHPMSAASSPPGLDEEEIEFLETFYGELEEMTPTGVVHVMPWLEGGFGPDWSAAERKAFATEVANGLLVLSDEDLGGGQERLPSSVQDFANGLPFNDWRANGMSEGRAEGVRPHNWLADAEDFSLLLENADPGLRGGRNFSANVTLSLGHHLGHTDLAITEEREAALGSLLDVTTRNEEANHTVLAGTDDHPADYVEDGRYASPHMPGFESNADALLGLYAFDWKDGGEAVAGLTDWIPEFSKGTPSQADMAGTTTLRLMETLAGDGDEKPFHDTGQRSDTKYELSVTEINPGLAENLTEIYLTYQEDLTLDSETRDTNGYATITSGQGSLLLHDPFDKALFVDGDTQRDFVQLLVADKKNAGVITSSVESLERKIIDIALDSPDNSAPRHAGANVGAVRTIVHDAMINEYVDRTDNREEAKQQAADNWQTGFNITVAISNGALGSVPVAGPVLAPTTETLLRLFEHPGKADFLEEWDQENQGGEQRPKDIIDHGPKSVQHAQLQLLDVMTRRGAIDPQVLVREGLLPSDFDAEKDMVVPSVRDTMGGRNLSGNYATLMEILEAAGKDEANRDSGENPVPDFFEGVRDNYVPDSKQDKGD
ncbi:TPR repeat region-containing protein [Nocardiopsis terrae]